MTKEQHLVIFNEIQTELKDELGVDISIEEINNIFTSQFKILTYGLIKGIVVTIPFFGKFIPYHKDYIKDNFITPNRIKQLELIKEGKLEEAHQVMVASIERVKQFKLDCAKTPLLSAEQILAYNNNIDIPDEIDILKNLR